MVYVGREARGKDDEEFSFRNVYLKSLRSIYKEIGTFGSPLEKMYGEKFGQRRHMN